MNGASYFSCQIKNVYITLSILYDSMGGGHHCSLIVIDLLLSYLKKVRGVGRNAGGEDRKTLTQRRLGGGVQFHCQGASLRFMHPHVSWDIIDASTGKY